MTEAEQGGVDVVPRSVRTRFAHAAIQLIANEVAADLLHIKGAATDLDLRSNPAGGTDADILVRPEHVERLLEAMWRNGWTLYSTFEWGSPFGHALTAAHPHWGFADIHRFFPGLGDSRGSAFDELWSARQTRDLSGVACAVPDRSGQLLIYVLNRVRNRFAWFDDDGLTELVGSPEARADFDALVERTGSSLAVDTAVGNLERHRGERGYALWKVTSQGGTRLEEWIARVRAAPDLRARMRLVAMAPLVNTDHLRTRLGHVPSRQEVVREFFDRQARGIRQEWRIRWERRAAGRGQR